MVGQVSSEAFQFPTCKEQAEGTKAGYHVIFKINHNTTTEEFDRLREANPDYDLMMGDEFNAATAFHRAATDGNVILLKHIANLVDETQRRKFLSLADRELETPLTSCIKYTINCAHINGHAVRLSTVRTLIELGANVNEVYECEDPEEADDTLPDLRFNVTPLYLALQDPGGFVNPGGYDPDLVRLLVRNGARLKCQNIEPIERARLNKAIREVEREKYLLAPSEDNPLHLLPKEVNDIITAYDFEGAIV